jgi:hypothetical protein
MNMLSIGGLSKARFGRMRQAIAGHVMRSDVPALVTLVSRRDEVHADALGMKEAGSGIHLGFRFVTQDKGVINW